jgi:haloalkane dehalogenase
MYPFGPHRLDVGPGRMHYVDEGTGSPIVMVHGLPTWSFLYRHLIRGLAGDFRCVAPDHLGFGLSDRPPGWSYRPADHAVNLERLVEHLGLADIILVVHDFGGPIGLAYALRHPDNVGALVLMNTFMWPVRDERHLAWVGRLVASPVGRFLYRRLNFSARVMVRLAFHDRTRLTPTIHAHYLAPFPTPVSREPAWRMARALLAESAWYESLWDARARIADIPALLVWGVRDRAFGRPALRRFTELLTDRTVVELDVGHFPQEEAGPSVAATIAEFLRRPPARARASP